MPSDGDGTEAVSVGAGVAAGVVVVAVESEERPLQPASSRPSAARETTRGREIEIMQKKAINVNDDAVVRRLRCTIVGKMFPFFAATVGLRITLLGATK